MEYREALHTGSKADGVIKCTYATIYDAQGKALFSMQNVDAEYGVTYEGGYKEGESTKQDMIITQLSPDVYFADSGFGGVTSGDADIRGGITMKVPLVEITTISNERLVPAKLTTEGKKLIIDACKDVRVYRYTIKAIVNSPFGETTATIQTTYTMPKQEQLNQIQAAKKAIKVWVEQERVINPRYEKLIEILESNQTIYIKPSAFDWYATDIKNATIVDQDGKTIDLDAAIAQAKKKMDAAKALLAGAAITNIF